MKIKIKLSNKKTKPLANGKLLTNGQPLVNGQFMDLSVLEKKIGTNFNNKDLLKEALTHRSYLNENFFWKLPHNERLEFLGDAVLELIVTRYLFEKYPQLEEGKLTLLRASLVNSKMLFKASENLSLKDYILLSKGEVQMNNRSFETILANAFEALIGAIYLDQGYEKAQYFVDSFLILYLPEIEEKGLYKDAKSLLQEIIQSEYKITPTYKVLDEMGSDHEKIFKVGVYFDNEIKAEGLGESKQEAELRAAGELLKRLGRNSNNHH